jgi:6-phosphofructokinase 1
MFLGSCRYKLSGQDEEMEKLIKILEGYEIGYFVYIGGNDSMDTVQKLSNYTISHGIDIQIVGVPKTIDNDLASTDHTLGYASAAKVVINTVYSIAKDAACYKKGKVHIVETMGRNVGWLAASADLVPDDGRPDLIYLPENKFVLDDFIKDVSEVFKKKGYAIVVISEGISFERGEAAEVDSFGHAQLSGAGAALAEALREKTGITSRVVELSLTQRANPFLLSRNDRDEAIEVGKEAVIAALRGETGKMIVMKRVSNKPYIGRFELADLRDVANAERKIPAEFMQDKTRMSDKFRDYLRPLIEGNVHLKYRSGIVLLTNFKKKLVK